MIPDTWTADGEGALPEPGPCPHDNSALVVEERSWRRPDSSLLNFMILLRYAGPRYRVACIMVAILN